MKHKLTAAFLAVAATSAISQNASIITWLPHVNGVPVPGVGGSSTKENCEAGNASRAIQQVTIYECKLVQRVTPSGAPSPVPPPPPPPPAPSPSPAPAPSPAGSIAQQIAADMSSPGDAKAHGIENWPQSQGAWSRVASSGLREEYVLPSGWNAIGGWLQAYRDTTNSSDTNTRVEIKDYFVYTLSKTGEWKLIASGTIGGAAYVENYATNSSANISKISIPGGVSVKLVHGYNFHGWMNRAQIDSNYAGIYSVFQARKVVDDPSRPDDRNVAKYVANSGADMWQSTSASYCGFNCSNKEVGFSRFKWITNDWQYFRFTNIPDARIAANPPPR